MKLTAKLFTKPMTYWFFTSILCLQIATGAVLDLTQDKNFSAMAAHLGYPAYLLTILGLCRILALLALLLPKFRLLTEWAYAGVFFELSLAAFSHIIVGDDFTAWIWAVLFALIALASYHLRPELRRVRIVMPLAAVNSGLLPGEPVAQLSNDIATKIP